VPVIMVGGDEVTSQEAKALLGDVETVVHKWGLGRNRARSLSIPAAHKLVRDTAAGAVREAKRFRPFKPSLPATIELSLYRADYADEFSVKPGCERVDARTVRRRVTSLLDICRW
jgi:D-aminopeptidase